MKKLFNVKLYKDAIKQLRVFGTLFTAVLMLYAVFCPMSSSGSDVKITGSDINPLFYLCFLVFIPVFTQLLFRFLNARSESDFYHSMPVKRTCLFVSYASAIMTWILFMIVITSLVFGVLMSMINTGITWQLDTIILFIFNILAACLYVMAVMLIAKSLTGTIFTNIIMIGILMFLPTFVISVFFSPILGIDYLNAKAFEKFIFTRYNLITGSVSDFFLGWFINTGSDTPLFQSLVAGIYTFVVGIVFFIAGCVLFNKRSSETAGMDAPTKGLSTAYKVLVAFSVTLVPIAYINSVEDKSNLDALTLLILYTISIIVYFGYEAIVSKSIKESIKKPAAYLIVIAMNVVMLVGCTAVINKIKDFTPSANEITSIEIDSFTGYNYYDYEGTRSNYLDDDYTCDSEYKTNDFDYAISLMKGISINDSRVNELIATRLDEEVNNKISGFSGYDILTIVVTINTSKKCATREIPISITELEEIIDAVRKTDEFKERYVSLPDYTEITRMMLVTKNKFRAIDNIVTYSEALKIYNTMKDEIASMGYEELVRKKVICSWVNYMTENDQFISTSALTGEVYNSHGLQIDTFTEENYFDINKLEKTKKLVEEIISSKTN